ncbi:hypothetical protein D3C84_1250410 [compost metagenome]
MQQRNDGVGREVNVPQGIPRFIQHIAQPQADLLQVRNQALQVVGRQRREQVIVGWLR